MDRPETQYAKTPDGISLAYELFGEGPIDLVFLPGSHGNFEIMWEWAPFVRLMKSLASFSRVLVHDRRGTGLSDHGKGLPNLETQAEDLVTVLDVAGFARPVLFGTEVGGAMAALLAATNPDRAGSIVWFGPVARSAWAPDYPWGENDEQQRTTLRRTETLWGNFPCEPLCRAAPPRR